MRFASFGGVMSYERTMRHARDMSVESLRSTTLHEDE